MSVLNLDDEPDCYLCHHTNYDYLLQMHDHLSDSSDKKHMYKIMYDMFCKRTGQPLEKEHKDIGFKEFQLHFDTHLLSLRACITKDIRSIKNMQGRLLDDIYKNGMKSNSIHAWMRLSQHKISIASKLNSIPKRQIEPIQPYVFD